MSEVRCVIHRGPGRSGTTIFLHLDGEFDRRSSSDLRRELRQSFGRARGARIVIDMAGVGLIGSECIEVLLVGYTRAMRSGHGFEVVNAEGHTRQALEATGLCSRIDTTAVGALPESAPATWDFSAG
jgi:anti-anti-sigma factor